MISNSLPIKGRMPIDEQSGEGFAAEVFVGHSAAMERLRLQMARFAPHFKTVLLVGEPGVGKQAVARELHRLSPVSAGPFCAMAIDEFVGGWKDVGGLVYLHGLGAMRTEKHEELLHRFSALGRETRVVVACEGEPRGMVAVGRLRAEVLERVGMLEMRVAPLRERMEDLETMVEGMLGRLGCTGRPDLDTMARYGWPGNVAELWRACEGFARDGVLRLERGVEAGAGVVRLEEVIERHVMEVLERCAGNKLKAAEMLGISRSTLYRMLEAG